MIKKLFKGLLTFGIIGLGLLNFSDSAWVIRPNGVYGFSTIDNSINLEVNNKGQLMSERIGNTKKMLAFSSSDGSKIFFFWSYNQKPYYYVNFNGKFYQGFLEYYYICDYFTGGSIGGNCARIDINDNFVNNVSNFFQSITVNDEWGYNIEVWHCGIYHSDQLINQVAFGSSRFDKVIMFSAGGGAAGSCNCTDCSNTTGSLGLLESTDFTFIDDNYLNNPPGMNSVIGSGITDSFSSGNTVEIPEDIDSYISYYEERFGWDANMCYVGTDDLDSVYGTPGISFEYGSGNTIYGLYYHLYSGFGSNKIHNVGSFINVWLNNYGNWYEVPEQSRILGQYNGPDQNVTYIYTGFTPPFTNKPVAIFFMASLLYDQYIEENSQGENIAFYCDMKLNYDWYKEGYLDFDETESLVDNKIKDRISEYNNRTMGGSDGYSYPGSGSIWDSLFQSGYSIPADLNPTDLFRDYFEKIDSLFKNFNPVVSVGFLPRWILFPMLFLILFRILKH